jgi:hypothetical protein
LNYSGVGDSNPSLATDKKRPGSGRFLRLEGFQPRQFGGVLPITTK